MSWLPAASLSQYELDESCAQRYFHQGLGDKCSSSISLCVFNRRWTLLRLAAPQPALQMDVL